MSKKIMNYEIYVFQNPGELNSVVEIIKDNKTFTTIRMWFNETEFDTVLHRPLRIEQTERDVDHFLNKVIEDAGEENFNNIDLRLNADPNDFFKRSNPGGPLYWYRKLEFDEKKVFFNKVNEILRLM